MNKPIFAIQTDYLHLLDLGTDSSLFIGARACEAGYQIYVYHPSSLSLNNNSVFAKGFVLEVWYEETGSNFRITEERVLDLSEAKIVLIRQNPPFDMNYVTSTYFLEFLPKTVKILNNPLAVRNNPEKLIPLSFPHLIPKTLIIQDKIRNYHIDIIEKWDVFDLIIKPLYGFGSHNITKVNKKNWISVAHRAIGKQKYIIVQDFLPNIKKGDTRVIMLDGQIAGAMKRIPAENSIKASIGAGATASATTLTEQECKICDEVGSFLKVNDIALAGLDIIDGHLIEVNITSPTGLIALYKLYNLDIAKSFVEYCLKISNLSFPSLSR